MQSLITLSNYMTEQRKRKRKTYLVDPLILENISILAKRDGRSENQYVERLLFEACKRAGLLHEDELLGETRGGQRQ